MQSYKAKTKRTEKVLGIVPCGKRKIWSKSPEAGPVSARDPYVSPYFKLCREFAERFSDKWVILPARYGFIDPDFIIPGDYDVSFKRSQDQGISIEKLKEQAEE